MNKSRIFQVVVVVCFLFALPQALLSQNKQKGCEFPTLGYFKILGKKAAKIKDFYEITIGYLGVDKAEEKARFGTIALRGHVSVLDEHLGQSNTRPEFEVNSIPLVRDSVTLRFESAVLTIDKKCKQSIKIVTENFGAKQYVVTATFLRGYQKAAGHRYKIIGLVRLVEEGKPTWSFRVKLARSRE